MERQKDQNLPKHCLKYQSWFLHLLFKVSFTRENVTQEFSLPQKVHLNQRRIKRSKNGVLRIPEIKASVPTLANVFYAIRQFEVARETDRVAMVINVHCGTVLGIHFQHGGKFVPQNSPTMHFDNHLDLVPCATSKW